MNNPKCFIFVASFPEHVLLAIVPQFLKYDHRTFYQTFSNIVAHRIMQKTYFMKVAIVIEGDV